MSNSDDSFRQLLADVPFDDSYRTEHRDAVRERALQAFDEAAADRLRIAGDVDGPSPWRLARRRTLGLGLAATIAAAIVGVLIAWYGVADRSLSGPNSSGNLAVAPVEATAEAEQSFIASVERLNEFKDDSVAAAFDLGVEVCLSEHYNQSALEKRVQHN